MRTVNNILDLSTDRDAFGVQNSMDAFKGTSFRFLQDWTPNTHYYNDEYVIDCVTYNGSLWICIKSHHSDGDSYPVEGSLFWKLAVKGGENGIAGNNGGIYVPYFYDGKLYFSFESNPKQEELEPINIQADFKIVNDNSDAPYVGWSYDGSTYNKICDVSYLRDSIHIGPTPPDDPSKIWIDTSEEALGEFNTLDFVYAAFRAAGGSASKESFTAWLSSLGYGETITDFGEIEF